MIAQLICWLLDRRDAHRAARRAHVEAAARRLLCERARQVGRLTVDLRNVDGFERDDDVTRRAVASRLLYLRWAVESGQLSGDAERDSVSD